MEHATITRTALVGIDTVRPHPANARRGSTKVIEDSLRTHGQYSSLVVQESTNLILKGNNTWRVMREKLGKQEVQVSFVSCSDAQALAILAVDNKSTDEATYDESALLALLETLDAESGLAGTGYADGDLDDLRALLEEQAPIIPDPLPDEEGIGTPMTDYSSSAAAENETAPARSLADKASTYDETKTRMVILNYPIAQFTWMVERLKELCEEWGLDSNADMMLALVEEASSRTAPKAEA